MATKHGHKNIVSYCIGDDTLKKLDEYAKERGIKRSAAITEILNSFLYAPQGGIEHGER